MSLEDRDWYRKEYSQKQKQYNTQQGETKTKWAEPETSASGDGIPPKTPVTDKVAEPSEDDGFVNIRSLCTKCGQMFYVRVRKEEQDDYSYKCPRCGYSMHETINNKERANNIRINKNINTNKSQAKTEKKSNKENSNKAEVWYVLASFYLTFGAIVLTSNNSECFYWLIVMAIYNIWMIVHVFTRRPPNSIIMKIGAMACFILTEGVISLVLYLTHCG